MGEYYIVKIKKGGKMELYEKDYNKLSKDMNILIYLFENLIINI